MIRVGRSSWKWRDGVEVSRRLWVKDYVGAALKDWRVNVFGRPDVITRELAESATQAVERWLGAKKQTQARSVSKAELENKLAMVGVSGKLSADELREGVRLEASVKQDSGYYRKRSEGNSATRLHR
jgi:hypothetical protein